MKQFQLLIFTLSLSFTFSLFSQSIEQATSSYICQTSIKKGKTLIAIFPFSGPNGEEDEKSKQITTLVISQVIQCNGLKVVDKSKVDKILTEQELIQSGIVDSESSEQIGKLLGAEVMVFGSYNDHGVMEVRLMDATTSEILGANVEGKSGAYSAKSQSKESIITSTYNIQMRGWLWRSSRKNQARYIYVTSTDQEWQIYSKKYPERVFWVQNLSKKQKLHYRMLRLNLRTYRKKRPRYNKLVLSKRRSVLVRRNNHLKRSKLKRKNKFKRRRRRSGTRRSRRRRR